MYAWVTLDKDRPPYLSTIFAGQFIRVIGVNMKRGIMNTV